MYPITTSYSIDRLSYETNHQYQHRCWFIAKQQPKTETEFNQAVKWSLIEMYSYYYDCQYNEEVKNLLARKKRRLWVH